MKKYHRRKCLHCGRLYHPDPRNRTRQRFCSAPLCKKESKRLSQQSWLKKSDNRDYFKGDKNMERVRSWREEHPGYSKKSPDIEKPLQETLSPQSIEDKQVNRCFTLETLQDVLSSQPTVLLGFISTFTGVTLQDDIASQIQKMHARGLQILGNLSGSQPQGNHEYTQTTPPIRSPAPSASAV